MAISPQVRKQKVFIIHSRTAQEPDSPLAALNELLAKGWRVVDVRPSNGDDAWYLVVAAEQFPGER